MFEKRIINLRRKIGTSGAEAALVMRPENVFYLSGYSGGEGYLVITENDQKLLTDFRYLEQAAAQAPHCEIIDIGNDFYGAVKTAFTNVKTVCFEDDYLNVVQFQKLKESNSCDWKPFNCMIESLRAVKDENELEFLRKAAQIADDAFLEVIKIIKPGVSELDIAAEMEYIMRKAGSEGPSFDFIIASGERGSLPHATASHRKILSGEMVTLDFGAIYNGYHSDITRTIAVGTPTSEMKKIYDIVHLAQAESLAMVSADIKCKVIDAKARDIIKDAGYGNNFRHGLGHGLGLKVHEEPRFNTKDESILAANMVMTVEPGIYIPKVGGVRIEDSVIVKAEGYELLTKITKDLIIL